MNKESDQVTSKRAIRGQIGRFRYLPWVIHGGTFFGEFDVFGSLL
jgi:hypothetical protein